MSRFLLNGDGRCSLSESGKAIVGSAGDPCCCAPECPNWIRAVWCCDPSIVAWAFMNRPGCPASVADASRPPIPLDVSVVLYLPGASRSCWRTDPANVRSSIPAGAPGLPVVNGWEIIGSCADPRCGDCPGCCSSINRNSGSCGYVYGNTVCCDCGSAYRFELHASSSYSATARVCEWCDGCRHVDGLFFASCHTTTNIIVEYGCTPDLENPGLYRRIITVIAASRDSTTSIGSVDQIVVSDGITFCNTTSVVQGPTSTTTEHFDLTSWVQTIETCGMLREGLDVFLGACSLPGTRLLFNATYAFDYEGQCSGTIDSPIDCSGSNAIPCCWASPPTGDSVSWSGTQSCNGGTFTATGTASIGTIGMDGTIEFFINGNHTGPDPNTFGACIEATWSATMSWAYTMRTPCPTEPCIGQAAAATWGAMASPRSVAIPEGWAEMLAASLAGPWGEGGCAGCGRT